MRIADSSALYAVIVERDTHHEQARAALEDPEPIVIPSEIMAETVALLQMRLGFEKARAAGAGLRATPQVRVEGSSAAIVNGAWEIFEGARGKLSLPDSFVVAWCRSEGASPLTFDREIEQALHRSR